MSIDDNINQKLITVEWNLQRNNYFAASLILDKVEHEVYKYNPGASLFDKLLLFFDANKPSEEELKKTEAQLHGLRKRVLETATPLLLNDLPKNHKDYFSVLRNLQEIQEYAAKAYLPFPDEALDFARTFYEQTKSDCVKEANKLLSYDALRSNKNRVADLLYFLKEMSLITQLPLPPEFNEIQEKANAFNKKECMRT